MFLNILFVWDISQEPAAVFLQANAWRAKDILSSSESFVDSNCSQDKTIWIAHVGSPRPRLGRLVLVKLPGEENTTTVRDIR